jgi:hypothetical protein
VKRTLLIVLGLAACSSGNKTGESPDAQADASAAADAGADAPLAPSKVYAHSGHELYRLDTRTNATVDIGPFGAALGTASITDIAVDKNDKMIGVTLNKIFTIDVATGTATLLSPFEQGAPNVTSLSFVPKDLNDPNSDEILVASDDHGNVVQIDPSNGKTTTLGNYGKVGNDQIVSSGDIVAVRGAGIFATVNVGLPLTAPDNLAKIDPTTWNATIVGTPLGSDKIFGLAYWGGKLYGFVDVAATSGSIIAIDPTSAAVTPVVSGSVEWFGAGVTTDAPIIVN